VQSISDTPSCCDGLSLIQDKKMCEYNDGGCKDSQSGSSAVKGEKSR